MTSPGDMAAGTGRPRTHPSLTKVTAPPEDQMSAVPPPECRSTPHRLGFKEDFVPRGCSQGDHRDMPTGSVSDPGYLPTLSQRQSQGVWPVSVPRAPETRPISLQISKISPLAGKPESSTPSLRHFGSETDARPSGTSPTPIRS